jgi:hypothetical protein
LYKSDLKKTKVLVVLRGCLKLLYLGVKAIEKIRERKMDDAGRINYHASQHFGQLEKVLDSVHFSKLYKIIVWVLHHTHQSVIGC